MVYYYSNHCLEDALLDLFNEDAEKDVIEKKTFKSIPVIFPFLNQNINNENNKNEENTNGEVHKYEYDYTISLKNSGEEGLMESYLNGIEINLKHKLRNLE
jgi:hypothetical protein